MQRLARGAALFAMLATLGASGPAHAQERGPIGVALDANIAFEGADQTALDYLTSSGVSAWYRLRPELSLGLTGEYLASVPHHDAERPFIAGGSTSSPNTILQHVLVAEAFADVHFYPSTFFGWFARASLGTAEITEQKPYTSPAPITTEARVVPILDLQLGPELALPLDRKHPRLALLLRLRGAYTQLGSQSLLGVGAGAGVEF